MLSAEHGLPRASIDSVKVMAFDEVMARKRRGEGQRGESYDMSAPKARSRSPPRERHRSRPDMYDEPPPTRHRDSHSRRRHNDSMGAPQDFRYDRRETERRDRRDHRDYHDRTRGRDSHDRRDYRDYGHRDQQGHERQGHRDGFDRRGQNDHRHRHNDARVPPRHHGSLDNGRKLVDPDLRQVDDDPRAGQPSRQTSFKKGMNTESFDPMSTVVRPAMRVHVGSSKAKTFTKELKHDDVVIVPEFFCAEDDWSIYYKLIEEMRELQASGKGTNTEWIPWHEGCHLVTKGPDDSPTFKNILKSAAEYFGITLKSVGTRFNWYRDGKDWKPFHHDSAAFNPRRAQNQNITVGLSFGDERELAFLDVRSKARAYFPQCNGMMFSFGRDVNINFKHGVNALAPEKQTGKGRISIILWGQAENVIEEAGSPPMVNNKRH